MSRILSFHLPNPFKKKPSPSAASLQKFMGPAPSAAAPTTAHPKAPSWSVKNKVQAVFNGIFKPAKTNAPVAQAQQGVVAAVTTGQPLVGNAQYQADLRTLAQFSSAAAIPCAVAQPVPSVPQATPSQNSLEHYAAALNAPDTYAGYAQWQEPQILAPGNTAGGPSVDAVQAALAKREDEAKQAMAQLKLDMESKRQVGRSYILDDGRTITARLTLDKDGKTRTLTIDDEEGFRTPEYGESFTLQGSKLLLNQDEVEKHWRPGPAMADACYYAGLLLQV